MCWRVPRFQSCLILCNSMDCSLLRPSVHGIFQARILEWVAISFSRRSSQLTNWTRVSCIGKLIVYHWATWLPLGYHIKDFFLQTPMLKIMIPPWTLGRAAKVNFDRLKDSRLDYYKKGKMNPQGVSSSSRPSFVRKTLKDKENMKKKLFKVAICVIIND